MTRTVKRFLFVLLAVPLVLLVLAGAVIVWVDRVDLRPYTGDLLRRLSAASGREVTVTGRVELDVSLTPTLRLGGLNIGNAPWGKAERALHVNEAEVQISLPELLRGTFAVRSLRIHGAQASIELNQNDEFNWYARDPDAVKEIISPLIALVHGADLLSAIDARVDAVTIDYYDHKLKQSLRLDVNQASLVRDAVGSPLYATLDGRLAGEPVALTGYVGAPSRRNKYKLFVRLAGRQAVAVADGVVEDRRGEARIEMSLHAGLSGTARINELLKVNLPELEPVLFSAHLSGKPEELSLTGINAYFGTAHLTGDVSYAREVLRPTFVVDLTGRDLDTRLFHRPDTGAQARRPDPSAKSDVLDAPLSLSWLGGFDLKGHLRLENAMLERTFIENADARIALSGGRLTVSEASVKVPAGSLAVSAVLSNVDTTPHLALRLRGGLWPNRVLTPKAKSGVRIEGKVALVTSGDTLVQALDQATVNSEVAFRGQGAPERVEFSFRPVQPKADQPMLSHALDARVTWSGRQYNINVTGEAPSRLLSGDETLPLRASVDVGELGVTLDGVLSDVTGRLGVDFRVKGRINNPTGAASISWLPAHASTRLTGSIKAKELTFSDMTVSSPSVGATAQLRLNWDHDKPQLTGNIEVGDLSLRGDAMVAGIGQERRVVPRDLSWMDKPLPFDWMRSVDAELNVRAHKMELGGLHVTGIDGLFGLHDGELGSESLKVATAGGNLMTRFTIAAESGGQARVRWHVQSGTFDLESLSREDSTLRELKPRVAGNVTWVGQGSTINELLDDVSGRIRLNWQRNDRARVATSNFRITQAPSKVSSALSADADVMVEGKKAHVTLRSASLRELLMASGSVPVHLALDLDAVHVTGDGSVTDILGQPRASVALRIDAPSLEPLRFLLHDGVDHLAPLAAQADLTVGPSMLELRKLALKAAEGSIDGWFSVSASQERLTVRGDLSIADLDLSWEVPAEPAVPEPTDRTSPAEPPDKLFSSEPFDLERLRRSDMDLRVGIKNVRLPGRVTDALTAHVKLDRGLLAIDMLRPAQATDSSAHMMIRLDARSEVVDFAMATRSRALDLRTLLSRSRLAGLVSGDLAVDIDLSAHGGSMADMAASLNGKARIVLENGQAKTEALDRLVGGVRAVMGQMLSPKRESTKLNCAICDIDIESGVATSRLTLLDTEYSVVLAEGNVNLGKEQIDLKFIPQAKGVTLSVASPVHLTGPLANPRVQLDTKGAIDTVVSLVAVVAYPPVLLLGLEDMVGHQDNPCISMVKPKQKGPIRRFIKSLKGEKRESSGTDAQDKDNTGSGTGD